eukprot:11032-Heterococcus_DN1.PRE.1
MKCAVKLAQQHPVRTTVKIITYYNQQRTVLQELLERRRANTTVKNGHSPLNCIDVCSIDACQGTEADIVIISTVRSLAGKTKSSARVTAFMKDDKRLNVALSRAKEQCVIVGDSNMFKLKRAGKLWASVVHHYYTTGARELF